MTAGNGSGREHGLAGQVLKILTRRGSVVAAVLVAAAIATVVAASATTHAGPAEMAVLRASGPQASMQGVSTKTAAPLKALKAVRGHLPKAVKRTHPRELHLVKAHSKVFDVRKLKSTVVKKERPERRAPGYAAEGSRAAEALENPARTAPQLPKVIKKSQMVAAAPDSSFEGLDFANWGQGHPPDTNGDVGPNHYIQTINVSIGIYNKSTGARIAAFTFNSFMSQGNFGNLCDTDNFGDPVVLYDSYEDRWVITDFAFKLDGSGNVNPQHAFQCFAVSKTGDPVSGGWNFYSIEAPGGLGDYPKFGVWPDGIYMSANMFGYSASSTYTGFHMWALNKQQMYNGDPTVQVVDFGGDTSDFTVIPANSRLQTGTPPPGSPEYFISTEQLLNAVTIYKFHADWDKISTSTFTGPFTQLQPNCWPNATPANASTPANAADVLAIRAMAQAQYSNLGGAESLWVTHTVQRNVSATNTTCNATVGGNASIRWYQANVTGGTVAADVVQGQTFDPEAANTFFRFMPAAAVNRNGDLAIGYTKSNSVTNPQLKYTGRLAGDAVNTLTQGENTLIDGTGAQSGTCGGSTCTRWGDYSGMALDPNGCTFWETGEYFATTGLNHQTRIGSFHFPGCTNVGNGTLSGTVTDGTNPISGATLTLGSRATTTNGSGQYSFTVPAGAYPSLTASKAGFGPASVATIPVPDGGTATRNFTLSAAAQSGCFTDNTQSTFQRGVPANCDLVANPGSVQLATPDNTDTKNANVNPTGFGFTNTAWTGQTFTPTVTGQLKRIDVELFCVSCSGTNPNITVSIRNTTGSPAVPTGADLATTTLAGFNDGAAGGLKTVTFASPITLTAGTRYAFIFRAVAARTGTYAYTCSCASGSFVNSNPYANGQFVTSGTSGASWTADTTTGGRDLNFITYINPGFAPSGTFVSSLKDANPAAGRTPNWTTLTWSAARLAGTDVKFQVAASNNAAGPFTFVGPDGTAATFFTTSGASLSQFNGFRYLKYKALLSTTDGSVTPSLSSVQVCFVDTAATSPTSLAAGPASGTFGGTTTLSATLTSSSVGVPGETVSFTLNGSSAGSAVTNGSGVATLNGVSLAGINAGSYPTGVGASFAGDPSYDPSSGSGSLTVGKADQAISVTTHAPASAAFNTTFDVAANAPGGTVDFSSDGACSNTGNHYTITTGTGTCSVNYDQAGNANYNAAPQVVESVSVGKTSQAINVTTHAPATAVYDTQFTVAATGGASGNPVTFSSSGSCSNTGAIFTMTSGTGTCSVKYDQAGGADYDPAPQVVETVDAQKANQTIMVTLHAPLTAVFNTGFSVAASGGGSGNQVTFSSFGVCTNTGGDFMMASGTGTCTVRYDQAGDGNYNAATQVTEPVTAQKASQSITFAALPDRTYGEPDFDVGATASSGLVVSFGASGQCTVTGTTIHLTGPGSCTITASQGGNSNYAAATDVPRTFQINAPVESVAEITAKEATCPHVAAGAATVLSIVDYTDKNGLIKKAVPNTAVYWVKVTVPAGPQTVEVDQAITSGNFTQKLTLANGGKVYTAACGKVKQPTFASGADGSVTVGFDATAARSYWVAVRYHANAVNGQSTPSPTTIHYLFSTAGVPSSSATLDFLRQAPAHSARSLRSAAFLRLLRR
jgi:hypothetical protein